MTPGFSRYAYGVTDPRNVRLKQEDFTGSLHSPGFIRYGILPFKRDLMKRFLFFVALTFLAAFAVYGPNPAERTVDATVTEALTAGLEADSHCRKLIAAQKMSVSLVDLRDPVRPRFAAVNGDEMMYAASLPKIAVLLAAMDALEQGDLEETPELKHDMRIMISKSDNGAASRMIDRVGFDRIAGVLTDPKYRLYDESRGGGLWVGKAYARSGERRPDPMKGLSHAATSNQVARFYYLLVNGKLVSEQRSAQMLEILEGPELYHKFVNTLRRIAPEASVFRKSGSWSTFHSDSALVLDQGWRRYILVALIDDPQGESICRELVVAAEEVIRATLPPESASR